MFFDIFLRRPKFVRKRMELLSDNTKMYTKINSVYQIRKKINERKLVNKPKVETNYSHFRVGLRDFSASYEMIPAMRLLKY